MSNGEKERVVFSQRIQTCTVELVNQWRSSELCSEAIEQGHQEPDRGFSTDLALQLGVAAWRAGWRLRAGVPTPPDTTTADLEDPRR